MTDFSLWDAQSAAIRANGNAPETDREKQAFFCRDFVQNAEIGGSVKKHWKTPLTYAILNNSIWEIFKYAREYLSYDGLTKAAIVNVSKKYIKQISGRWKNGK